MKKIVVLLGFLLFACTPPAIEPGGVPDNAFDIRPLMPGQTAPRFEATDASGKTFVFDPGQRQRPAAIIFYRGGWCPVCNMYWSELRKIEDEFYSLDIDVIYLSADSVETLANAVADEEEALRYHLLSDASSEIAQAFGIAFRVDDETYKRYIDYKIDLEAASGFKHHRLPAPAAFIVGTDGVIKFAYVNPDYSVRLHPDLLLAAAKLMPDYNVKKAAK